MKKLTGFVLAAAFAVTATTTVSAQTVADLQAQIDALLAQLASVSTTTASTSAGYNFTSDLTIGSTGPAVVELQTALEMKGSLVMPVGVSKGYFGALTQSALASYQASVGISPASGYFGPITRAHFNSMVGTTTTTTTETTTTTTTTSGLSGGEASLEDFDISSEDDAEEGEMAHVATVEFDVEDGDVEINRVDVSFVSGSATNEETDPWDVFETITLMIDGEEVAEEDIDDEDDWLDEDEPFVFRLSGLDYVVDEGDTVEIEIYLTTQSSVDGADTNGNARWDIAIAQDGIRAVDSMGIQNYIGELNATLNYAANGYQGGDFVTFDVEEEGGDEDIEIKTSSNDPKSANLLVDEDVDSDWHEVFIFRMEADENDIDIEELAFTVTTADAGAGAGTYNLVVEDVMVEIDGEEFDDFDVVDGGTTTADLTFDIDGDFTVDADETVEVVVLVQFRDSATYTPGSTTIQIENPSVEGEGVDDVEDAATFDSSVHTLTLAVAEVTNVSWSTAETDTTGVIDFFFTVTAEEDDFDVLIADIIDDTTGAAFENTAGVPETAEFGVLSRVSGDSVATLVGNAGFTVAEGDTTRFRVRYNAAGAGAYEATIESVAGVEIDDEDQLSPTLILEAPPVV